MPEFFTLGGTWAPTLARIAEKAEADGWDGLMVVDSQSLAGDCYAALTMAATTTTKLKLGTGVSNPLTRHPAANAAGIGTVHALSGGRAVFGIGRGDSALSHIGLAPARASYFERYVNVTRRLLRGEEIPFDDLAPFIASGAARGADALGLAGKADTSRLHWRDPRLPDVSVEIAATGPAVLGIAGRQADRVLAAVGADPRRVAWAISTAQTAATDSKRTDQLRIGAFVNVVAHPDRETAHALVAGGLSTFARFSVMDGSISTPVDEQQRAVLEQVHEAYDMRNHTQSGSPQSAALTPEFIDTFGIAGPPEYCVTRLRELADLGVERFVVIGPSAGSDPHEGAIARHLLTEEVLPALRSSAS